MSLTPYLNTFIMIISKTNFLFISCVFPSEFPERTLNGKRVRTHSEFLDYLCMKHHKIRKEKLPFVETDTAKNVVLYMLEEDI